MFLDIFPTTHYAVENVNFIAIRSIHLYHLLGIVSKKIMYCQILCVEDSFSEVTNFWGV